MAPVTSNADDGYYWDRWQAKALAAGVPAHLAGLGRDLMRDLAQHTQGEIQCLGHGVDGDKMIAMALAAPVTMELRFASDLQTPTGISGRVDDMAYAVLAEKLGGAAALEAALASEKAAYAAAAQSVTTHRYFKDDAGRMTRARITVAGS